MTKLILFIFLAHLGVNLGNAVPTFSIAGRIVGGNSSAEGQFPYQVSLQYPGKGHFCGASIVSKWWILTAAHCVMRVDKNFNVIVGATNLVALGPDSAKHKVSQILLHPKYREWRAKGEHPNDLALIKVQKPIKFTNTVKSIDLPEKDMDISGLPVVASGWGRLSLGGKRPVKLQYLHSKVYDHKSCVKRMAEIPGFAPVTGNHICSFTGKGKGLCHGDSGGPIVADGVQVGIVSMGYPCARGYPDVNTNVWSYLKWIKSIIDKD